MKSFKSILCCLLVFLCVDLYSQFGVRTKYSINSFNPSQEFFNLDNGLELGIDYWFRLKERRIEFLPELSFEIAKGDLSAVPSEISFNSFNFIFNINLYPLDFYNDCDCPTFSKDGNAFTKGLHIIVSPGLRYYSWDHENIDGKHKMNLMAGLGVGVDIGINDLLTVTPFTIYRHSFSKELTFNNDIGAGTNIDDSNGQILLGIRLGFRPDYQTPRFRR